MPHPECPSDPADCRIRMVGARMATAMDWTPVYDGNGVMLNSDPNTYTNDFACDACGGEWTEERTGGDTVVTTKTAPRVPQQLPKGAT